MVGGRVCGNGTNWLVLGRIGGMGAFLGTSCYSLLGGIPWHWRLSFWV